MGGEEVCSFSDGAGLHSTQQDGGKRGLSFVPCTLSSMSFFFFLFLVGGGKISLVIGQQSVWKWIARLLRKHDTCHFFKLQHGGREFVHVSCVNETLREI